MPDATGAPTLRQKLIALLALTAVSTAIGVAMKVSQVKGKYNYNPISAMALAELYKLVVSCAFVARFVAAATSEKQSDCRTEARVFASANYSVPLLLHSAGLALAYAVVNLVTFGVFAYSSASMFFLFKAASPIITALMLAALVGRPVTPTQWAAILMQCVGLVATQYDPCRPAASGLPFAAYACITVNVAVSCAAGVWNEHVIKSYDTSVNALNTMMYSMGGVMCAVLFLLVPPKLVGGQGTLGFFEGYNWSVLAVVAANGSVGLVITAVFKYADVVVKTFGLAGSTMILFLCEMTGVLPSTTVVPSVSGVLGAATVFYASFVYIAPPLTMTVAAASAPARDAADADVTVKVDDAADGQSAQVVPVPLSRNPRLLVLGLVGVATVLSTGVNGRQCD